ncbi:hypothetical protein IEU95_01800 [Hoyosella rhizosphaerae]|uniref:Uncharacterized protein n=1 Tax=Hoyosella rhizosphaerae TaxID=1755582 RepID=A0A916XFL6_9ACTN|nr:hypothetical protein [Hoyosella rhizosphaerae]MBN4925549.1 hypothetical protein [Hoyosella rhizosphaerae]GGC69797.1 hypothetical protein GCM10011410_23270 [Hoyosella rhizosphaerae]
MLTNGAPDDDDTPPIPDGPPYSEEFLAHFHGGVYPDDQTLLASIYADPDAVAFLQHLENITDQLRRLRPS